MEGNKNTTNRRKPITRSQASETISTIRKSPSFTSSDQALRRLHGVKKQLQIRISKLKNLKQGKSPVKWELQQGFKVKPDILKVKKNKTVAKMWPCPEPNCAYKTNSRSSLALHMRIHTGAKPCVCQFCPCKFRLAQHLKIHVTLYHSTNENNQTVRPSRFICEICQFPSSSRGNLKIHMRKHSDSRPFECPFCGHATKHKSSLNAHIRTHTKEKPYQCNLCSYAGTQSTHLLQHIRTHTKETPVNCEQSGCDYATSTMRQLKIHLFKKHGIGIGVPRAKKYKCELCSETRAFHTREQLDNHTFRHTGLKLHQCQWCSKKYSTKSVKVSHEKTCAVRPS